MYDPETASLIRSTPLLEGLNREELPELFSKTFAQIAAARIRLREANTETLDELKTLVETMRRLAYTNEALVSVLPDRENRSSAAFVAATAHQLCINADKLFLDRSPPTFVNSSSISSNISAMLLFMVAEATADAGEVSKVVELKTSDPIEQALIITLRDLATGKLLALKNRAIPKLNSITTNDPASMAAYALYLKILEGLHALADEILLGGSKIESQDPIQIFETVRQISIGPEQEILIDGFQTSTSSFPGPYHLASLLIAVARDLSESAVTQIQTPPGLDSEKWEGIVQKIAKSRPFLWQNHRDAIAQGYLEPGISTAVSFPTGAGKSTLAELKISTAFLAEKNVIFLAPTHALVDQTSLSLKRSFPTASIQRERQDEFGFKTGEDVLPDILVMTPESCLTQMSIDVSIFEDVGLVIFDECHLLHPGENPKDRRAIDAMLCVLNISNIASNADFLLMSAMMKNSDDIAGWIKDLTGRTCLSLNLSWKPTRQLKGSVVYQQQNLTKLQDKLKRAKRNKTTKGPPVALKRKLNAIPLALFSMKQTWITNERKDYTLVNLLDDQVQLGANDKWWLTPNAVSVSSSISAAAASKGLKTLVFFQTIKNAASAAKQVSGLIDPVSIKLKDDEVAWLESAIAEFGSASHLFIKVKNNRVVQPATVHHGLLLPEERALCESLFKRSDGINILTATSTLAQGMNLPSELVIIGEDSRFDQATGKREILKAQELLNAAGRAGRAGENSTGIVLVVPGNLVGIDLEESSIGPHWIDLREIFSQSDQCLEIDDPITAVLDRIHVSTEETEDIDRYTIVRLASGGNGETDTEALSNAINSTFGAYLAKKNDKENWVQERIGSAINFFGGQSPETERELVETQVAASLGLSVELVSRLSTDLEKTGPDPSAMVPKWRRWFFNWLSENPELLEQVFRPQTLIELFGQKAYEALTTDEEKSNFVLPILKKLTWHWMRGDPLRDLEEALGTKPNSLKTCIGARRFVIRIIPELSYLFGLPAMLHERRQATVEKAVPLPSIKEQLGRCVRLGFNSHEKTALSQILIKARFSRRQLHKHYALIKPHLSPFTPDETWKQTLDRVENGTEDELNSRSADVY